MATHAVFERFLAKGNRFDYGSTASGHPACAAAGLANIEIIINEKLADNAAEIGKEMALRLAELKERSKIIGDVRGKGLMIGIELVKDQQSKVPLGAGEMGNILYEIGMRGLIVYNNGNTIALFPPLIIGKEIGDEIIGILDEILKK